MSGVRNQRYRNQIKDPVLLFTKKPWTRHAVSKSLSLLISKIKRTAHI